MKQQYRPNLFVTFLALPSGKNGDQTGILCNFEDFGTSMGMYINETTVMCVTPHIQGRPEDYARETVQVTVAMNGQDFNDMQSDAYVTFVGTGTDSKMLKALLFILLLTLLILACVALCMPRLMAPPPKRDMPIAQVAGDTQIRTGGSIPRHMIDQNYGPSPSRQSRQYY